MPQTSRSRRNQPARRLALAVTRSTRLGVWLVVAMAAFAGPATLATAQQAISLAPAPSSAAAASAPSSLAAKLKVRGNLTLRNSTLSDAMYTISKLWSVDIVYGDLPNTVNGVFKQAPLREILDSLLLSNGYAYRAVGESLVISEISLLGQVNPYFESAAITIRAADINEVVTAATQLTTPQGSVQAIPSANSIFVLDFPDRVQMVRELVASLDTAASGGAPTAGTAIGPRRLEVAYMKAHYISAESASDVIRSILSPEGRVTIMPAEDRLLVVDYLENLQVAERVIARIDRPRPQVRIRSLIYDLSLTDMEEIGVNWSSLSNGGASGATLGDSGAFSVPGTLNPGTGTLFNSVTTTAGATGGAFTLYNVGSNLSLAAIALLMQEADDSRLLASPNVTVTENEEAVIQSVTEIPFQQLQQTGGGGNIGTTAFKEAGITLQVRPKIARDGTVEMNVRPEFSLLTGFTPGENQPIIDRRTAQTTVRVANGHTLVLGGMRQRSDVGSFSGIPFLKDVRVLGNLFRSRETTIRESELVVFITPTIVGFDSPTSQREGQVLDTVTSQLDQIPAPSGCQTGECGLQGACGIDGCGASAGVLSIPQETISASPQLVAPALPPPPTPTPVVAGPVPSAPHEARAPQRSTNGPENPTLPKKVRRLPPIDAVPSVASSAQSQEPKAEVASGLRTEFSKRFRERTSFLR